MKRLLILFTTFSVVLSSFAQKAHLKIGYDHHYYDPRGIEKHDDFILLAGADCSKFYNGQSQWLDSMRCTKEGEQWYVQQGLVMMGELMNKSREEREAILRGCLLFRVVNH